MLSPEAAAFLSLLKQHLHSAPDTESHSDFLSLAFLSGHRDNTPCPRHKRGSATVNVAQVAEHLESILEAGGLIPIIAYTRALAHMSVMDTLQRRKQGDQELNVLCLSQVLANPSYTISYLNLSTTEKEKN